MPNPVTHFEILGRDGKQLQDFYSSLFDWQIDASNPMQYGLVPPQGNGIGGGVAASEGGEPQVTVYVEVTDLAAALRRAQELGGRVVAEPMDVPGGPRIAQFADPAGNVIGLTQSGTM